MDILATMRPSTRYLDYSCYVVSERPTPPHLKFQRWWRGCNDVRDHLGAHDLIPVEQTLQDPAENQSKGRCGVTSWHSQVRKARGATQADVLFWCKAAGLVAWHRRNNLIIYNYILFGELPAKVQERSIISWNCQTKSSKRQRYQAIAYGKTQNGSEIAVPHTIA